MVEQSNTIANFGILPYLNALIFKRITAWGVSFVVGGLALSLHDAVHFQTLLLLAAITLNYWIGFTLNDYYDIPYDVVDRHKARGNIFIWDNGFKQRFKLLATIIGAYSMLVFASFGWGGVLILLLGYGGMWAYSAPPLRLKSIPGLDVVVHACFVQSFPYWVCMSLIGAEWTALDYIIFTVNILCSVAGQIYQQLRDFEVDRNNSTNLTIWIGTRKASLILKSVYANAFIVVLAGVLLNIIPLFLIPVVLLAAPVFLHRLLLSQTGRDRTAVRVGIYGITVLAIGYTCFLLFA